LSFPLAGDGSGPKALPETDDKPSSLPTVPATVPAVPDPEPSKISKRQEEAGVTKFCQTTAVCFKALSSHKVSDLHELCFA
jgi:hypothetical protein